MVEQFFHNGSSTGSIGSFNHYLHESPPIILLSGPSSSGKTSLLFQFSLNVAVNNEMNGRGGGPVVFICKRNRLEAKPPLLSKGLDSYRNYFERIQMKYLEDDEGIKKFFSAFHLFERTPAAVIIDDFGEFFDERRCQDKYGNSRGKDLAVVRVLALCCNAIIHANTKSTCPLLLSDIHHGDTPRLLYIYKRWISSIFTIKGDGMGSFLLKETNASGKKESEKVKIAKYSTIFNSLCLDEMVDHETN